VSSSSTFGRNRTKFRKVYGYELTRRPDVRQFFDTLTSTSKSFDFQKIGRDRNYFLIQGYEELTFPTGSSAIIEFLEDFYSLSTEADSVNVTFSTPFTEVPYVGIVFLPEGVATSGSNVAYWISNLTKFGFTANFSGPTSGTVSYLAVYTDSTFPIYVTRPSGSYGWVSAASYSYTDQSTVTMSFDTLPSVPVKVMANPIGLTFQENVGQAFASVGTNYLTNILSTNFTGTFQLVALASDPAGTPQPVDPP
jgi:hypothetical protein